MELDKRIKKGKKPLMCFDIAKAKQFIGKKGLFGTCILQFKNLDTCPKCVVDELKRIANFSEDPFVTSGNHAYMYFLPEEWLKEPEEWLKELEKKYRPYSLDEFLKIFNTGDLVEFRYKDSDEVKCAMFTGYITDVDRIDDKNPGLCELLLGCFHYSLLSLFKECELFYNGKWQPFGVIVKENEE